MLRAFASFAGLFVSSYVSNPQTGSRALRRTALEKEIERKRAKHITLDRFSGIPPSSRPYRPMNLRSLTRAAVWNTILLFKFFCHTRLINTTQKILVGRMTLRLFGILWLLYSTKQITCLGE